ncbi:MAG: aspartate-semialdehyde dehydrogenase [Candidatus Ranarchaeia archaeon]
MNKIKVAILGATGAVGQRFVSLLEDHPFFEIEALMASEKSTDKKYSEAVSWILDIPIPKQIRDVKLIPIEKKLLDILDVKVVFSAIPASFAGPIEEDFANDGLFVASNASSHRMAKDVPILIPDVNPDHIELLKIQRENRNWTTGALTTNSNCSTSGLVMALKPLESKYGIDQVEVTTMQAISGAGYPGVPSLDITENIVPYIQGEEEKMETEPNKILGKLVKDHIEDANIKISATCTRVPVINGHLESVSLRLNQKPSLEEFEKTLRDYKSEPQSLNLPSAPNPPLVIMEQPNRPQPRKDRLNGSPDSAKGMATSIGKIKETPWGFKFLLLVHNTIRGAAGANILASEFALKKNYLS